MLQPVAVLQKYWKYPGFRAEQEQIINNVLDNKNTIALMPTGGGKTLCFQIPALVKNGVCIVVSPLVALINDQILSLKQKQIKAIAITGGLRENELSTLLDNVIYGNYKFLYVSPERLQQEMVLERIKQMDVSMIAIDEAHCISQWGNNFRPAYRNCTILKQLFPNAPLIALTASATPKVLADIKENLQIESATVFRKSFARPNIAYMTFNEANAMQKLLRVVQKNTGSSIAYVSNRKATKDVATYLEANQITADYFHGGMSASEKNTKLTNWLTNKVQVMVATNAFGMGIDKPDVRTVVHLNYPDSIESYFQEAGRAGRDGQKAFAVLFKNNMEQKKAVQQYVEVLPDVNTIKFIYKKLHNYFQIAFGEWTEQSYPFNFNQFCNTYKINGLTGYNTLKLLDRFSIINLTENFRDKHTVLFKVNRNTLEQYLKRHSTLEETVEYILRSYGGIFSYDTDINITQIATRLKTNSEAIEKVLQKLHKDEIITYAPVKTDAEITFLIPREDDKTINTIAKQIKIQHDHIKEKVTDVIDFINNDTVCKSVQLLNYFGESDAQPCGICSVCITQKTTSSTDIYNVIKQDIFKILQNKPQTSIHLCELLTYKELYILDTLNRMLNAGLIGINLKNEYYLLS